MEIEVYVVVPVHHSFGECLHQRAAWRSSREKIQHRINIEARLLSKYESFRETGRLHSAKHVVDQLHACATSERTQMRYFPSQHSQHRLGFLQCAGVSSHEEGKFTCGGLGLAACDRCIEKLPVLAGELLPELVDQLGRDGAALDAHTIGLQRR